MCHDCAPVQNIIYNYTIILWPSGWTAIGLPKSAELGSRHDPRRFQLNVAEHTAYKNIYNYRFNRLVRYFTYTRRKRMENNDKQFIFVIATDRSTNFLVYSCQSDGTPDRRSRDWRNTVFDKYEIVTDFTIGQLLSYTFFFMVINNQILLRYYSYGFLILLKTCSNTSIGTNVDIYLKLKSYIGKITIKLQ